MSSTGADPTAALTWVVGAGGLLGSAVTAALPGGEAWRPGVPVPWTAPDGGRDALRRIAGRFLEQADGRPWQVAWCAGAGVTSTTSEALDTESRAFAGLLDALAAAPAPGRGALFLASSAGGLYAGAGGGPHDEHTVPAPLAPYGRAKLGLEEQVRAWTAQTGTPAVVGRISNLYGPGQNLAKPQGLISQIVRSHLLGRPISIYVPLDTVRDNLYVTDAAHLVVDALARLRREPARGRPVVKVLASQQGVTIGFLIAELGRILKRRPRVVFGTSSAAAYQARDLRMRSVVWPELDRRPLVPLPVGISRTVDALRSSVAAGLLT